MYSMKLKNILATLLLLVAGLQTAWGQGFRVYKSDGTVAQFSLRTDSIVFYDGIGTDEDFGPFTPVNQCIAKKWYMSKSVSPPAAKIPLITTVQMHRAIM